MGSRYLTVIRLTEHGNTVVENHPELPYRSVVLFAGSEVFRSGVVPPASQSVRIRRVGGW